MKNVFLIAASSFVFGCNMDVQNHAIQIQQMEDSVFKTFPTVNRVSIEVKDDFSAEVSVTLGDAELYNAPEQTRKQVSDQIARMTKNVFAASKPEKGKVIFVKEETTTTYAPGAEKTYIMPLQKTQ